MLLLGGGRRGRPQRGADEEKANRTRQRVATTALAGQLPVLTRWENPPKISPLDPKPWSRAGADVDVLSVLESADPRSQIGVLLAAVVADKVGQICESEIGHLAVVVDVADQQLDPGFRRGHAGRVFHDEDIVIGYALKYNRREEDFRGAREKKMGSPAPEAVPGSEVKTMADDLKAAAFEPADDDKGLQRTMKALLKEHHPGTKGATWSLFWRLNKPTTWWGTVKVSDEPLWWLSATDLLMYINQGLYESLSEDGKIGLVDHLLSLAQAKTGGLTIMETVRGERQLYAVDKPSLGCHPVVAARNPAFVIEIEELRDLKKAIDDPQGFLFDFGAESAASTAPPASTKKASTKKASPRARPRGVPEAATA